jgi:hypothetical protein
VAPNTTDAAALLRTVCVLAKYRGDGDWPDVYRTYIGPAGITVEDHSNDREPRVEHVTGDAGLIDVMGELQLTTCRGAVCTLGTFRTDVELGPDPNGRLWVTKGAVRASVGPNCSDRSDSLRYRS